MRYPLLCATALLCIGGFSHGEEFPSVETLIDAEAFEASGLHKLNETERQALRTWLWTYTVRDAEFHRRNSTAPNEHEGHEPQANTAIKSHIVGEFTGWDGDTIFELANGQVWQQRRRARYSTRAVNPEVVVEQNLLGFFELKLVESGRSIQVKRIK